MPMIKRVSAALLVLLVLLSCCSAVFASELPQEESETAESVETEPAEETKPSEPEPDQPDVNWQDGIPASVVTASEDGSITASLYLPEGTVENPESACVSCSAPNEEEREQLLHGVAHQILAAIPEEDRSGLTEDDLGDISYMVGQARTVQISLPEAHWPGDDLYYVKLFLRQPLEVTDTQKLQVFRKDVSGGPVCLASVSVDMDSEGGVTGIRWWDITSDFGEGVFYLAAVETIDYSVQPASDDNQVSSGIEAPSHGVAVPGGGTGSGTNGSGSYTICSGVELQVVYYKYKDTNTAAKAHGNIVATLQAPEITAYDINGNKTRTIYDGVTFNRNQFVMFPKFSSGNTAVYRVTWPYSTPVYPESLTTSNRWDQWGTYRANWGRDLSTCFPPFATVTNSAVDHFLRYIILSPYNEDMGEYNSLAQWDRSDVDRDNSLFEQVLAELISGSEYTTAVTNYKNAIQGKLPANSEALIPAIIWTWIGGDSATFGSNSEKYMTMYTGYGLYNHKCGGDYLPSSGHWWYTPFANAAGAKSGCPFGSRHGVGEFACRIAFGTGHGCGNAFWTNTAPYLNGVGVVNRISKTDPAGKTGPYYYLRGYWTPFDVQKTGTLTVKKVANCSATVAQQLSGNSMYSLAGAKYQVIVDNKAVETLVTNSSGVAVSAKAYPIGTKGTIREVTAPKGYLLDSTAYAFEIRDTGNTVTVKDTPTFDPEVIAIRKTDPATGTPQGNASFAGAVFKWEYFDNTSWSGTPKRTWYFQTNSAGQHAYEASFLASGYTSSALYVNTGNLYSLPLGSVRITEVAAPAGYKTMPVLYATITQDASGKATWHFTADTLKILSKAGQVYSGPEPIHEGKLGSVSIRKVDADTSGSAPAGMTFAGCEFSIYNRSAGSVKVGATAAAPGQICCTLTTGADGTASTGNVLPMGSYEIRETKGNENYQANSSWSYSFTVNGTSDAPGFSAVCANTLRPGKITLIKADTKGAPLSGAKLALEWSTDGTGWSRITRSNQFAPGNCSSPLLDADGCLTTGSDGAAVFENLYPTLKYRIMETEAPEGHTLLKDPIYVELQSAAGFETAYRIVNGDTFTLPNTGSVSKVLFLLSAAVFGVLGAMVLTASLREDRKKK